ncbi:MAG TPA: DinB family protein [Chthonomonadales bacterium]|nr:DinB family protein [Chthonomonadales bacterium]
MPEVNVSQMLASRLRSAADQLVKAIQEMPADRADWQPDAAGHPGRSALNQVLECAYVNEWAVPLFRDRAAPAFDSEHYRSETARRTTVDEAAEWLMKATTALTAAVAAFPEAQWAAMTTNPFTKQPQSWAEAADVFYWNMVYHVGQIGYIQTLYGDDSM